MAKDASSEGALRVSRCSCEMGRKRHRIPKSIQIPFEAFQPIDVPIHNHDSDDESGDDTDEADQDDGNTFFDGELFGTVTIGGDFFVVNQQLLDVAFPNGTMDLEMDMDMDVSMTSESAPDSDQEFEGVLPKVATWRMNLTALSQFYNIYMVAYENKIYISRPRSCVTNALPAKPDLILEPPASLMSYDVGGYLDPAAPHQVNHLIVGELGDEEILLLAYDDGDVIGYYTKYIESEISRREKTGNGDGALPAPFFHENVLKSAWGLAIHKKSRLIAVSSNLHNVSVFVFALSGQEYRHIADVDSVEFFRNITKNEDGNIEPPMVPPFDCAKIFEYRSKAAGLEEEIQDRNANWRIVLRTGHGGTNIPNIAFSSDTSGEADKVVAVDINGKLWLMDIWHLAVPVPHATIEPLHRARVIPRVHGPHDGGHRPRGWGVLVLPESSFLPTNDVEQSLGLPPSEAMYLENERIGEWIDNSKGIEYVKNNSTIHPWVRSGNARRFNFNAFERMRVRLDSTWYDSGPQPPMPLQKLIEDNARRGGHMSRISDGRKSRLAQSNPRAIKRRDTVLADESSILRTYELDIELRGFKEDGVGIMFEKVIDQSRPPHAVLEPMRPSNERLANLIHVPELSLVVAGSLCGRVALITLTRPEPHSLPFKRSFKIEAILPTKRDEDTHKRPICPLLGVAIGPIPFAGNESLAERPTNRRRYRIMLHYYDLRILSYEISRGSPTDPLTIV
ncbi:uncharacterized protein F4822DRAFT_401055 [Hypoxylon trugodes]|uniref:uncharacterized protein n=1 Tax=Hypoxylon trugodes TaxID=326681 RepID=UPI0021A038FF|nr:uncharacterized protein F4822DRAFT_401055 [Hypoxylon trugodes]KAI1390160.1 hypothetical protein F4822DRAFT_401055 [Hypoxylon trugodes]